jgi:hypothetical protein
MIKTLSWNNVFQSAPVSRRANAKTSPVLRAVYLWVSYGLITANTVLLVSYFIGVNSATSKGYEIKKLQTNITSLNEENKKLTLKISEKTSMAQLQTEIANSSFVPVGNSVFVEVNRYTKR